MDSQGSYKIKLPSGRILGPLDLERIRLLIKKNQITGKEVAREYPLGEWKDINEIPELAELIVAYVAGTIDQKSSTESSPLPAPFDPKAPLAPTAVLPGAGVQRTSSFNALPELEPVTEAKPIEKMPEEEAKPIQLEERAPQSYDNEDDRTRIETDFSKTSIGALENSSPKGEPEQQASVVLDPALDHFESAASISTERTVVFQRSTDSSVLPGKRSSKAKDLVRSVGLAILLGIVGYYVFLDEPEQKPIVRAEPIKPKLPDMIRGRSDPKKSTEVYGEAMSHYVADTVLGYRIAASKLRLSAGYDINNVKALAMLASSYINLIDSSNKDENYFAVLSKLIEMSRAKSVELPETVIADVEFFLIVNKPEAAQNRIVEYTKSHGYGATMIYYLALAYFARGDYPMAARFMAQYPEQKPFSAKVFYLRGQIAERLQDDTSAMQEYGKAFNFNSGHAKSRLRIAVLMNKQGKLKEAAGHIDFLINNRNLLTPKELALAYYLHNQLSRLYGNSDIALGDIERAVKLDPDNHDYLLEMYTMRAEAGDSLQSARQHARMYSFLSQGERLVKEGKYQDALVPFLQARQANESSPLPLVKIGDMFTYIQDIENARMNYKLAAARAPDNIQVWSKYIQSLIQSYEWEEAKKAMDKFRKMETSQSAIDKAAADIFQKQGRYAEAQVYYQNAMSRESIDPDVYIAYAKSLMSTRNYKDAPFFFALALRFDPLNIEAIIYTAKCVAETESIDRAISMLQDELKQRTETRADFLAAIAEFEIQKGAWPEAQQYVFQAIQANKEFAYSWKLQAQIYMNREGLDKDALDNALAAYKSYSERNKSDPSGYLERYRIFIKKAEFEKAKEELNRIYEIYPKYPNLHYYLGALYSVQGNHKAGAEEFSRELQNNPENAQTLISFGKELLELGNVQQALDQFSKAMRLAPTSAEAKQNAGWANYYLKNYQAAVSLLRSALTIDKGNPVLFKRLGIVQREMGDGAGACASFRQYLEMEPDASDKADYQGCF